MSRVRVLNVPRSATEAELKLHFTRPIVTRGVTETLEVTDCRIVKKPGQHGGQGVNRMAFVGFRTAGAADRAIQYFDGTFVGTQKIRLQHAQSLPEARTAQTTKAKRSRDEPAHTEPTKPQPLSELDRMKAEFVDRTTRMKDGPSWSSELLVPASTAGDPSAASTADRLAEAEAAESTALQKQQYLEDVADDDFLAGITAAAEATETEASPAAAPAVQTTGDAARSVRAPAQQLAFDSKRVRIANIPYIASAAEVKSFLSTTVGDVDDVHVPVTRDTKQPKGIAFANFRTGEAAVKALVADGSIFMGRLVRITAAEPDPYKMMRDERQKELTAGGAAPASEDRSSFKKERLEQKKRSDGALMWNPLFVESATAVSKVASSLGVTADAVVSVDASGAAVRAAVAEAHLTTEAARTLGDEGINLAAVHGAALHRGRSSTTILVKHLPKSLSVNQLGHMFAKFGQLEAVAAPASGAFVLVAFLNDHDAQTAFHKLAYKMVGGTPLFLEWAPVGALNLEAANAALVAAEEADITAELTRAAARPNAVRRAGVDDDDDDNEGPRNRTRADDDDEADKSRAAAKSTAAPVVHVAVSTVYVTNLPFGITESAFTTFLQNACPKITANPALVVKINLLETKGRAFVAVADPATANYLIAKLNNRTLDGRPVQAQLSTSSAPPAAPRHAQYDANDEAVPAVAAAASARQPARPSAAASSSVPAGCNPLKVAVKNLPFEATEKDLRQLFTSFCEVKSVRVPQKVGQVSSHHKNNHRGFGFVEFLTEQEAANAIATLGNTHLYGRHLVLEYAKL